MNKTSEDLKKNKRIRKKQIRTPGQKKAVSAISKEDQVQSVKTAGEEKIDAPVVRRCERCGVWITDETWLCPLCRGAITMEGTDLAGAARSVSYPDISYKIRKMRLATKITVFAAAVAAFILLLINYLTFNGIYWSLIAIVGLIYGCSVMIIFFGQKRSLQWRIIIVSLIAAAFMIALDNILGYSGWSVRFGIPILIMCADVVAIVFMTVNINGWQNYIITEIVACVFGILLFILELTSLLDLTLFGIIAAAVSAFVFAGTLLFGRRMIRDELKRRFIV